MSEREGGGSDVDNGDRVDRRAVVWGCGRRGNFTCFGRVLRIVKVYEKLVKKLRNRLAIGDEFCEDTRRERAEVVGHEWRGQVR